VLLVWNLLWINFCMGCAAGAAHLKRRVHTGDGMFPSSGITPHGKSSGCSIISPACPGPSRDTICQVSTWWALELTRKIRTKCTKCSMAVTEEGELYTWGDNNLNAGQSDNASRRHAGYDKNALIKLINTKIKTMVCSLCNNKFRMHFESQSASDAVKAHLQGVATRAQTQTHPFCFQTQGWPEIRRRRRWQHASWPSRP
jgi:hypothetical protein